MLSTISEKQRQDIYHKWVGIRLEQNPGFIDQHFKLIAGNCTVFLLLFFATLFFNWSLRKQVTKRTLQLQESKDATQAVLNSAGDLIIVIDANSAQILDVNHRMTDMYGYSHYEALKYGIDLLSLDAPPYTPDDLKGWLEKTRLQSLQTFEWLSRHKDGHTFWVETKVNYAVIGGENRLVIVVRDISERKQAEEALNGSLAEKEVLLKEIHHRVKNNMQVISSLMDLQADEIEDTALCTIFEEVSHRVHSIAMVHEKLYQSDDLARVEFADYSRSLLEHLFRVQGAADAGVRMELDLKTVYLTVNEAVPCGLILNELFSNAMKHAFKGPGGKVSVTLDCDS